MPEEENDLSDEDIQEIIEKAKKEKISPEEAHDQVERIKTYDKLREHLRKGPKGKPENN